jgi:gamma-glutamyl:cysteine ligase YbdK (ATP-grasp superfamily)
MARPRIVTLAVEVLPGSGADIATVDALARLVLAAQQLGLELRITRAPSELRELVALAGLGPALGLQAQREPEQREEALGVEEKGHLGDLPG